MVGVTLSLWVTAEDDEEADAVIRWVASCLPAQALMLEQSRRVGSGPITGTNRT